MQETTKSNRPPWWLIVDGTNQVHVDAFGTGDASKAPDLLVRRVTALAGRESCAAVVVAFDSDAPTFRHGLVDGYKAGRTHRPEMDAAIEQAKIKLIANGIRAIAVPGFEADDIIATVADHATRYRYNAVVYSADRDLHQLIRKDLISQITSTKFDRGVLSAEYMTSDMLIEEYGVHPSQWCDFKILVGDKSDSIEGVRGIGPDAAAKLLKHCGTIDRFYESPFDCPLTDRQIQLLIRAKRRIPLLRQLVTLRRDVPMPALWWEGV